MLSASTEQPRPEALKPIVNDFSMTIATINGSGSQTANSVILRAVFKMGIPVSGKNLLPSNIKGMPTWYIIRVNKDGYVARRDTTQILVAMNQKTIVQDFAQLPPGGVCLFDESLTFVNSRTDVICYPIPVKNLVKQIQADPDLKNYVANMVYVGVLASILQIDLTEIEKAVVRHFGGKQKAINLNMGVINTAWDWAKENLLKTDPYVVEPMNATAGMILIDGNTAGALGSIYGGVSVVAWYPITPSTSMIDAINTYLPRLRRDPETGKATCAVIQAEDELSAIGILLGAGWAGSRAMTATSGPGISLMAEFAGMGYFAEVPIVVWDVMRVGPSTGLPTRTSQGDITFIYTMGHGDTQQVCLFPADMKECFEFGITAFDLAEQLQTPVFVLSDLDLGLNQWMSQPFEYPQQPMNRGKVLTAEDLERLGSYGRHRDVDGDGVPYRTLPGTHHPLAPYVARGTGHNADAVYSEHPDDWEQNLARLAKKFQTAAAIAPAPSIEWAENTAIGFITCGSTSPAVTEARQSLAQQGIPTGYLRLRALPPAPSVEEFINRHQRVYVVENNFSGQMRQILCAEFPHLASRLHSIARCNGLPLSPDWVTTTFLQKEGN